MPFKTGFFILVAGMLISCGKHADQGAGDRDATPGNMREIQIVFDGAHGDTAEPHDLFETSNTDVTTDKNDAITGDTGKDLTSSDLLSRDEDVTSPPSDRDHDGVPDLQDDCPDDPNGWKDTNHDGKCNDLDDNDNDGIPNGEEKIYGADCAISDPNQPDTDGDGINDNEDPFPRDPFVDFILFRNDKGTIDLELSKRDGTFTPPKKIGAPYGCTPDTPENCPANLNYSYKTFVISDFDNNGRTDFLAIGSSPGNKINLWWFYRTGSFTHGDPRHFEQRLVDGHMDRNILGSVADLNNDNRVDLVVMEVDKPQGSNVVNAKLYSYLNTGLIATAKCGYTEDPVNPQKCAFIRKLAADLKPLAAGNWMVRLSHDAVDMNGDGNRDMAFYTISSGSNVTVPVYILSGKGDGTFDVPGKPMFEHNNGKCGASPANSIVFGDFNNDGIGDIVIGWDDDGDSGSAWFYPGKTDSSGFGFDSSQCFESIDLNPAVEDGEDKPGVSYSARAFDFNFDGNLDIILGWDYAQAFHYPSQTVLFLGQGNGHFQPAIVVRDFPNSNFGMEFASPQRLCRRFFIKK